MSQLSRAAAMSVLLLALTACGGSGGSGVPQPSYDAAVARAHKNARHVFHAVKPRATKMAKEPSSRGDVIHCSKVGHPEKISITFGYRLTGVSGPRIKKYFANFEKTFEKEGWKKDPESHKWHGVLMSKNGYSIVVETLATKEYILIGVNTPCVTPKDSAEPSEPPPQV